MSQHPIQPQDSRKQEADLLAQAKSYRQEPGMQALKRLLELRLAKQDRVLRRCPLVDIAQEQAKAAQLDSLLNELYN